MKIFAFLLLLAGCNAVNIKPHSLDKSQIIYADRGGYTMKYAVKDELDKRGYTIKVAKISGYADGEVSDIVISEAPKNARYAIRVQERTPTFLGGPLFFSPIWCAFNGFWWWEFNVSIADQKTGEELLAWTGRGCQNSSIRRLRRLIDELEQK
ncbi:MAG: hypothetical protein LBL46_05025 [Rickettsiales bacterium]|nr:hypothetical protein [Rickettsiales bacterium]